MRQWATRKNASLIIFCRVSLYIKNILSISRMEQADSRTVCVDPHCFDADPDPDPAQNLHADPDPDPDPGGGVGQSKMCIPPGKILGTPLLFNL
jgi:hypothetical protein